MVFFSVAWILVSTLSQTVGHLINTVVFGDCCYHPKGSEMVKMTTEIAIARNLTALDQFPSLWDEGVRVHGIEVHGQLSHLNQK